MVAHLAAIYLITIRAAGGAFWISLRLRATVASLATGMAGRRTKFVPAVMSAISRGIVASSRRMRIVHA
jgi:hypothetical protein